MRDESQEGGTVPLAKRIEKRRQAFALQSANERR
jgi:hypothetical protein